MIIDVAGFYPPRLLVEGAHWRRRAFWCRHHGLQPSPADATLVFKGHEPERLDQFNRRHRLVTRMFARPFVFATREGDHLLTTQPYNADNDPASLMVMASWAEPLGLAVQDRFAESWWSPGETAHYVIARPEVMARLKATPPSR
jgi:hypothetical protein